MPVPLIGITTYNSKNKYQFPITALMHKYSEVIIQAGGLPLLIPNLLLDDAQEGLLEHLDGVLFTGGGDIALGRFDGESSDQILEVDESRDEVELSLISRIIPRGIPFLGICRGIQVLNVALGGTLYTHIPDQLPGAVRHNRDSGTEREVLAHDIAVSPGTRLEKIVVDKEFLVNSLHHQGVKQVAAGLKPCAHAIDGLVEGLELSDHPFGIAVQWHPEWLTGMDHARRLFKEFVEACRK